MALLLIDFGSTFTKVSAVDVEKCRLLGTAQSPTTAGSDIGEGLNSALSLLEAVTGSLDFTDRLACSSAAGGLRMAACGLVPELTVKAAREACLGAGAKIIASYSFELTAEDIASIDESAPDILLLTGGTDGGNSEVILHNSQMLAGCKSDFPILPAGNRSCAAQCLEILGAREVIVCKNVMPAFGRLDIAEVSQRIRELFLKRIVRARGLGTLAERLGGILMPTPAAVLEALQLLSSGVPGEAGIGDLMAIDLGGATTDVYSMATGAPERADALLKGLPEPFAKRTVEGDIGMRYTAAGVLEAAGAERLSELSGLSSGLVEGLIAGFKGREDRIPECETQRRLDFALAAAAVETASLRHAGTIAEVYTPVGPTFVQSGKNLKGVQTLVATGGALLRCERPRDVAAFALASGRHPLSLRPRRADILIDSSYILAGMGLLAQRHPRCALRIMKEELKLHGT